MGKFFKKRIGALVLATLLMLMMAACTTDTDTEDRISIGLTGNVALGTIADFVENDQIPATNNEIFVQYTHTKEIETSQVEVKFYHKENNQYVGGGMTMLASGSTEAIMPVVLSTPGVYTLEILMGGILAHEEEIIVVAQS